VLSVAILRFDYTTVAAVAVLFGVYCLVAAATQTMIAAVSSSTGWRIAHGLLAALLVVAGVVSFCNFGATFDTLTAIISFYFIVAAASTSSRPAPRTSVRWWVLLICGFVELGLGFWAAGSWKAVRRGRGGVGRPLPRWFTASATLHWDSRCTTAAAARSPASTGSHGTAGEEFGLRGGEGS
jgi:hypothetical protein